MQECIRVRNATIRKAVQTEDRQVTKKSLQQETDGAVQDSWRICAICIEKVRENAEVIAMSIFEYDKEEEEQKLQAIYEKQGELRKEKSIAISLAQEGESVERIARILGETEKTIKEWMAETH